MKTEYKEKLISLEGFITAHAILTCFENGIKKMKKSQLSDELIFGLMKLHRKTIRLRIRVPKI